MSLMLVSGCKASRRSASKMEKCRLNRRTISTNHWCTSGDGTTTAPAGAAGEQLLMKNQARLNGFAEPDFIGQQYLRGITAGDLIGNV